MRNLHEPEVDRYRDVAGGNRLWGWAGDETCGAFRVPIGSHEFTVVASSGMGWDHVSVSLKNRCPSWGEMESIKRLFFRPDEIAMQLHVATSDHISFHPNCLHIWRPQNAEIPLPPKVMVA